MLQKHASNSVMTVIRSKYSHRLTDEDYNELFRCKNVADIAAYLKSRTKYSGFITENLPQNMHRGYLENCLKNSLYSEYAQIGHYCWLVGEEFYRYIIMLCEMRMLSSCLRNVFSGHAVVVKRLEFPEFIKKHADFDYDSLTAAADFNDLLRRLKGSRYEKVLKQFTESGEKTDYGAIDAMLHRHVRESMMSFFRKSYKGETRDELLRLLSMQCDLVNLMYIYRLKFIMEISPKYITPYLLPAGKYLTDKDISSLLDAANTDVFIERASRTVLGRLIGLEDMDFAETKAVDILFGASRKNLYFSSDPPVAIYSYILLAETEINNITYIIEGIRYGMSRDEIGRLLVNVNVGGDS